MRTDAAAVLMGMGYVLDRDFRAYMRQPGEVTIEWYAQTKQPTEAEIDAAALAGAKESLDVVSAKAFKTALYRLSAFDAAEQAVNQDKESYIAWTDSEKFARGDALMTTIAAALPKGVTLADVFATAKAL